MQNKNKMHLFRIIILLCIFQFYLSINISNSFSQSNSLSGYETAKGYFKKGFVFFNHMHYLSAVEFFRKAVSAYPEYYSAREYLARSYKLAGFVNEAIREWEILASMTSNNVAIINKIDTLKYRLSAGEEKLLIGANEFVFSDVYDSENSGRYRFSKPMDIAVDGEKNIYISSFSSGKLVKLSPNGEGLAIFDKGITTRFYGVACYNTTICVSDFKTNVVHILDKNLKWIKSFGSTGNEEGQFHGPKGLCFDEDGNIFVVDSGNHRLQKFDRDGKFILKFGTPGEYEGELNNPSNIFINKDTVYITDTDNNRVASFDDSGNFIKNISIPGLGVPRGISVYEKNLLISDEKNGLIFYSLENGTAFKFASWNHAKKSFSKLVSAQRDRDGLFYCLDYNHESVFIFSPIQAVYTNLDVEITSVDTDKYPVIAYYMNIRSRDGRPVYNLEGNNFKITDDNASISNIYADFLKNEEQSASFVLCVDRSMSNRGYHNYIPWVSDFILKKMKKNDSLELLNFNKDAWVGNKFDWSRLRTIKALRNRNYSEGKAIDKALYNAIGDLAPKLNRRGIVLITDGGVSSDSFSKYTVENVIEYARSHYIPVYIIVFKEKDTALKRIADETGGGIFKASELDGLRSIYDKIRQAEEYRYVAIYNTYKNPSVKDWWADVKIEVNYKGQKGVEWCGYFVP